MGSGFRVWTAGEVVSASNVNNYLQEQAVMSFAGTAARSSAIASPEEGMLSYLQDSDTYQGYDGSAWVNLGTLSGASDSGLVHIETADLNGLSSFSFNNVFTSAYDNYRVLFNIFSTQNNLVLNARLRASGTDESGSVYNTIQIFGDGSTAISNALTAQTSYNFGTSLNNQESIWLADILSPVLAQNTLGIGNEIRSASGIGLRQFRVTNTTAYDGITLFVATGNITSGKASIYGYRK